MIFKRVQWISKKRYKNNILTGAGPLGSAFDTFLLVFTRCHFDERWCVYVYNTVLKIYQIINTCTCISSLISAPILKKVLLSVCFMTRALNLLGGFQMSCHTSACMRRSVYISNRPLCIGLKQKYRHTNRLGFKMLVFYWENLGTDAPQYTRYTRVILLAWHIVPLKTFQYKSNTF